MCPAEVCQGLPKWKRARSAASPAAAAAVPLELNLIFPFFLLLPFTLNLYLLANLFFLSTCDYCSWHDSFKTPGPRADLRGPGTKESKLLSGDGWKNKT